MPDPVNVLMVGVGGQGIVLASDLLAEAALRAGHDVKKSEIHGMSQRGGAVFSHVRYGERVHSPMIPRGEADVLYALERMELLRWAPWARPDAVAVHLAQDTLPTGVTAYPPGLDAVIARTFATVVPIAPRALRGTVSPKVRNTVVLGAVSAFLPGIDASCYLDALPGLCPVGTADVNAAGFALGRELAASVASIREAAHVE